MRILSLLTFLLLSFMSTPAQNKQIVVSADGTGDFTTVQAAINSVRDYRPEGRTEIFIKNGTYREKVICPSWKTHIALIGENRDSTIITFDDHAKIDNMGTFRSYTLKAEGIGFEMENITVENNAPQVAQAVALHVEADRAVFRNCRFLGFQDTVFNGNENARQYFENCYIEGTTDFLFGPATVWLEGCEIRSKRNSYITAASTPPGKSYGYVFNNCRLTADEGVDKVFLGRPWRAFSAVVFMNCEMGAHIVPAGWDNWRNPENEKTVRYYEFNNRGAGSNRTERVKWSRELTRKEARQITKKNVLATE